ncbi:MAG: hypothetical protein ACI4JA_11370 [Oscillospiraceae bacterium]
MKKMFIFLAMLAVFTLFPVKVFAQPDSDDFTQTDEYREIVGKVSDSVESAAGDDVNEILEDNDISIENSSGIADISVWSVLESVFDSFVGELKKPVALLGEIIAIAVLCSLSQSLAPDGAGTVKVFKTIGVLCSVAVIYDGVYDSLAMVAESLNNMSRFMLAYIPVFSSIAAAGGSYISGGSYYAGTLILCEIIAVVAQKILMPFLSIVMAVSLVAAINPELSFCGAADSIKKCVQWILGGLMTIFSGLLTIQSITGSAADSVAARTVKFAASSFIPIIGGAVSEAYSTVYGSLGVIRAATGTIGIIIIAIIVVKPILTVLAVKLVITVGKIINEMFCLRQCGELLNSTNAILSMALSVMIAFSMMFIISTAVLMMTAMNIAS